ncbi:MAG: citrate/2-methylcitrate synthase [Ilumatobacteraceae bacterium]
MTEMLTADEAANRLGIKLSSLYAYVSRGLVERHATDDGRSMFDAAAIGELARRGRPRVSSRETSINLLIETELTRIDSHRVFFRGHDTAGLATTATFEEVAELLWLGELAGEHEPWTSTAVEIAPLPHDPWTPIPANDRLRIALAYAAAADPFRANLDPPSVASAGRHTIATMVDGLREHDGPIPRLDVGATSRRRSIAARLWVALAGRRRAAGDVELLNAALVLLADHELAGSTLAARVAASTRADPYAVIGAGLGVVNGPLHGRASSAARRLLDDAAERGAGPAITEALSTWRTVPGFGHPLYPDGDPRARVLLAQLRATLGAGHTMRVAESVIDAVAARTDRQPNVDLTLAVLTQAARMPADAGEVIFAVARCAGWLAHALEEYRQQPLRFRPRAAYVGVRNDGGSRPSAAGGTRRR